MISDLELRRAIRRVLETGSGSDTRVITRWKLSFDPKDWKGALKSRSNTQAVDAWLLTRRSRRAKKLTFGKWEYRFTYVLWYIRDAVDGSEQTGSEYALNDLIERVAAEFEQQPTLGLESETSGVDNHEELQVLEIDTVDNQYHIAQCELTVVLTQQR